MAYTVATVTEVKKIDDLTVDFIMGKAQSDPAAADHLDLHDEQGVGREEQRRLAGQHQEQAGELRDQQRQRHRRVQDRVAPGRREDDLRAATPRWWGPKEHNLTEVVYTPIQSDATRVAALLSGEVDMVYPVPQQDAARISGTGKHQLLTGFELRTIFVNMDQSRDELLESSVKGKNPFKDKRVRQALYQAIDMEAIKSRIMGGTSNIAGIMVAPGINGYDKPSSMCACKYDPDASKKLLAEAGYPSGFEIGMDCPNDRYVNDEKICQAIVGMLARIGVKVNLLAQTRSKYFEKILSRNTTLSILGWQPLSYDAHSTLQDVINTPKDKIGTYNVGSFSNKKIDELTDKIENEVDPAKRQALITRGAHDPQGRDRPHPAASGRPRLGRAQGRVGASAQRRQP